MSLEGQQIGRYRLMHPLGGGGMGEVYLAEDTHIRRQVAIKVTRAEANPYPDTNAAKETTRLFQREMRAIAMLDHPYVLPLFDYGEEVIHGVTLTYMVMPFRSEGSLTTWLRQRSGPQLLPPQDVAHFVRQAADALQYAHDHQIIHQDVKPSNFLIRSNKENPNHPDLLLADFGIAKLTSTTASVSQTSRGTPAYMAPEQWGGHPVPATDQYALAIMAYQLLTGQPPFQGRQEQIMFQHFQAQPEPPSKLNPHLPKDLDTVILHALAKKPEERFASISAFARAFQEALQSADRPRTTNVLPKVDNIRATLTISKAEALHGTTRTLTLPEGRQVNVVIPAGTQDGQLIRLEERGEPASSGGSTGTLLLTIAIKQAEENTLAASTSYDPTIIRNVPPPNPVSSQPPDTHRPGLSRAIPLLLLALILLLVGENIGFFYFARANSTIPNPYPPYSGTLALDDSLAYNNGYKWGEDTNNQGGTCAFTGGAYHIGESGQGQTVNCIASASNFADFAYEVKMTIIKGDAGGIIFRADVANSKSYYFRIGQDGSYALELFTDNVLSHAQILKSGSNSIINTGTNQSNLIAVVAQGTNINLYVNLHLIYSVSDSTYSQGQIGLIAEDINSPTEVAFSNARVWTL